MNLFLLVRIGLEILKRTRSNTVGTSNPAHERAYCLRMIFSENRCTLFRIMG
jgi:hypothetical protein